MASSPRNAASAAIEWTGAQAEALRAALAGRKADGGAPGYCELAGFLFALACSPEPVMPSEWIPRALGEEGEAFDSLEEAQRVVGLMMALHNRINFEVMERKPALAAGSRCARTRWRTSVRRHPSRSGRLAMARGSCGWKKPGRPACATSPTPGRLTKRSAASMWRWPSSRAASWPRSGGGRCPAPPRWSRPLGGC